MGEHLVCDVWVGGWVGGWGGGGGGDLPAASVSDLAAAPPSASALFFCLRESMRARGEWGGATGASGVECEIELLPSL